MTGRDGLNVDGASSSRFERIRTHEKIPAKPPIEPIDARLKAISINIFSSRNSPGEVRGPSHGPESHGDLGSVEQYISRIAEQNKRLAINFLTNNKMDPLLAAVLVVMSQSANLPNILIGDSATPGHFKAMDLNIPKEKISNQTRLAAYRNAINTGATFAMPAAGGGLHIVGPNAHQVPRQVHVQQPNGQMAIHQVAQTTQANATDYQALHEALGREEFLAFLLSGTPLPLTSVEDKGQTRREPTANKGPARRETSAADEGGEDAAQKAQKAQEKAHPKAARSADAERAHNARVGIEKERRKRSHDEAEAGKAERQQQKVDKQIKIDDRNREIRRTER